MNTIEAYKNFAKLADNELLAEQYQMWLDSYVQSNYFMEKNKVIMNILRQEILKRNLNLSEIEKGIYKIHKDYLKKTSIN